MSHRARIKCTGTRITRLNGVRVQVWICQFGEELCRQYVVIGEGRAAQAIPNEGNQFMTFTQRVLGFFQRCVLKTTLHLSPSLLQIDVARVGETLIFSCILGHAV
jgi:hypothetical protein